MWALYILSVTLEADMSMTLTKTDVLAELDKLGREARALADDLSASLHDELLAVAEQHSEACRLHLSAVVRGDQHHAVALAEEADRLFARLGELRAQLAELSA